MKIAFIGAGKMAEALLSRLSSHAIMAADVDRDRLTQLKRKFKIKTTRHNTEAFDYGEIIFLAVKPQQMGEVLAALQKENQLLARDGKKAGRSKLVISIAAGIPLSFLQKKLPGIPVIRAMPNNPCLAGDGMTALAKGKLVSKKQLAAAKKLFQLVGEVIEVPEKWMDAVTGLSGSGPAFVYEIVEGLASGGVACGLPRQVAELLALKTVAGAAAVIKETKKPLWELVRMVASPGGTTVEGLKVLNELKVKEALIKAVTNAAERSGIITKTLAA